MKYFVGNFQGYNFGHVDIFATHRTFQATSKKAQQTTTFHPISPQFRPPFSHFPPPKNHQTRLEFTPVWNSPPTLNAKVVRWKINRFVGRALASGLHYSTVGIGTLNGAETDAPTSVDHSYALHVVRGIVNLNIGFNCE